MEKLTLHGLYNSRKYCHGINKINFFKCLHIFLLIIDSTRKSSYLITKY